MRAVLVLGSKRGMFEEGCRGCSMRCSVWWMKRGVQWSMRGMHFGWAVMS